MLLAVAVEAQDDGDLNGIFTTFSLRIKKIVRSHDVIGLLGVYSIPSTHTRLFFRRFHMYRPFSVIRTGYGGSYHPVS